MRCLKWIKEEIIKKTLECLVAQWERVGHFNIRVTSWGELCHIQAHAIGSRKESWFVED